MTESLSDLLKRCQNGDQIAYQVVVKRFQSKALDLAKTLIGDQHLAEDAVQQAFLTAFCRLDQLREYNAFAGWFRQIVRTEAIRTVRNKQLKQKEITDNPIDTESPYTVIELKEIRQIIHQALSELSETNRETAEMFYLDEQSCTDVASRLGIPAGTVRRRLHDARKQLREMLRKYL